MHICDDLGKKDQVHEYVVKLRKAERAIEQPGGQPPEPEPAPAPTYSEQQQQQQQQQYYDENQPSSVCPCPLLPHPPPPPPAASPSPCRSPQSNSPRAMRCAFCLFCFERGLRRSPRADLKARAYNPGESDYEQSQMAAAAGPGKSNVMLKKVAAGGVEDDHFADVELDDDLLPA